MSSFVTLASSQPGELPAWAVLRLGHHFANAVLFVTELRLAGIETATATNWTFEYVVPKSLTHLPYHYLDKHIRHIVGKYISEITKDI